MAEPKQSLEENSEAVVAVEAPPREQEERREHRKDKPKREPNYHVIIWNDEEHTYEYVIELLMKIFSHPFERAFQITDEVHHRGKGIAQTCHKELAELKRDQILAYGPDPRMKISKGSIRATIEPAPD